MLYISLLWITAGLLLIYSIGINEIITAMSMDASLMENEDAFNDPLSNPVSFAMSFFWLVLLWPALWIQYKNNKF